ncbi:MAG: hypothetical protein K0U29_02895 [Gammaproteobacteria bacterium]|nr:hypothetical protein [Gammaproteobacteria bacterium]MCH9743858.1 hypothetical protein [Gammaproteobacteria bacterium]
MERENVIRSTVYVASLWALCVMPDNSYDNLELCIFKDALSQEVCELSIANLRFVLLLMIPTVCAFATLRMFYNNEEILDVYIKTQCYYMVLCARVFLWQQSLKSQLGDFGPWRMPLMPLLFMEAATFFYSVLCYIREYHYDNLFANMMNVGATALISFNAVIKALVWQLSEPLAVEIAPNDLNIFGATA